MSFCLNVVARALLQNFWNEKAFVETIRVFVEKGLVKPKLAEKMIIWYYQENDRLRRKLEETVDFIF